MIIKKLEELSQTKTTMYEIYKEKDIETVTGEMVKIPELVKTASLDSLDQEIKYTEDQIVNLTAKKEELLGYKTEIESILV